MRLTTPANNWMFEIHAQRPSRPRNPFSLCAAVLSLVVIAYVHSPVTAGSVAYT